MINEIIVEDLVVEYDGYRALEELSFKMKLPKFLTIMGPNGAGKTTLLRALIGLIKPVRGNISVLGFNPLREALKLRRLVGYVPQRERIEASVPFKVKSVVLMGRLCRRKVPRIPSKEDIKMAKEALAKVGAEDLWDKPFSRLSGGQQQRVLIARALISNPKLLLLDEPLTAIDVTSQWEILETLKKLERDEGIGIILVTHDINPVVEYTDEVMLLNRRLIAYGSLTDVLTEENLKKAYGPKVKVVAHEGICYAITGDIHVRHSN
ncbi:MAG: metal ABC transporter ATP-binding protein [Thaumarchaeota archaeon]|nr:MAG: metal ABC transporter ATP-binding protein [Nitrososphaerota archaeon]